MSRGMFDLRASEIEALDAVRLKCNWIIAIHANFSFDADPHTLEYDQYTIDGLINSINNSLSDIDTETLYTQATLIFLRTLVVVDRIADARKLCAEMRCTLAVAH